MAARARGVRVSCDLNYRDKLWTREEACTVMTRLAALTDVCRIANDEDARDAVRHPAGRLRNRDAMLICRSHGG